jgi:hypothetical protein
VTTEGWPDLPAEWQGDPRLVAEHRRLILRAQVDLATTDMAAGPTHPASLADDEAEKKLHDNLATLSAASIDRAREGAKFIETAAAALGTIYTGVLGFVFAASDKPLPGRGLYAAVFLGIAVVGAAYYLGFIQRINPIGRVAYSRSRPENLWRRTEWLAEWTGLVARTRSWALRGAVFALAFGVAFMPAAFLPDVLSSNPFVMTVPAASPQPTLSWPSPPTGVADPALAAVLYKAQLDEFVKTLDKPAAAEPDGAVTTSTLLFPLFVISLLVTVLGAAWDALRDVVRRLWSQIQKRTAA